MRIINGRLGADAHIGKTTCHTYNGSSCVDYFLGSPCIFDAVCDFEVCDINEYSDHCPLTLSLPLLHDLSLTKAQRTTNKMVWNSQLIKDYQETLIDQKSSVFFNDMMCIIQGHSENDTSSVQ